jgi:WD40 repeat protein
MSKHWIILPTLFALGVGGAICEPPLASAASNAQTKTAAPERWQPLAVLKTGFSNIKPTLAIAPDGKTLAAGAGGYNQLGQPLPGVIQLWDLRTRKLRQPLKGHNHYILALAFTGDSKTLLALSHDGVLKHWDVAKAKARSSARLGLLDIMAAAFTPDRKLLATSVGNLRPNQARLGGQVQLWNTATGRLRNTFQAHEVTVNALVFTPDGKTLLTGGSGINRNARPKPDGTSDFLIAETKFWNVATRRQKPIRATGGNQYVFSADGKVLATEGYDLAKRGFVIKIFDLAGKKAHATRTGHQMGIYGLAMSHDGRVLASAGMDRTIKLWDVATAKERATLRGHRKFVYDVAFTPDGKGLVSISEDSTIRLWGDKNPSSKSSDKP